MSHSLNIIGAPSSAGAYAPGQEKAPEAFRRHGLIRALMQGGQPLSFLLAAHNWRALTITEVNPDHAPDESQAFRLLNQMLCRALVP